LYLFPSCAKQEQQQRIPSDYDSWSRVKTEELDYPIPGHESHYRIIYINKEKIEDYLTVQEDNGKNRYEFKAGTIIVKDVFPSLQKQDSDEPFQLTAMIKAPDEAQSRGGWLWVVKDLETQEEKIIDHEFCITCHANANESHPYGDNNPDEEFRDYVFFAPETR
jgi:hypothetical protein